MSDYLKPISLGDRIDPPQEVEGARFAWIEDHCELRHEWRPPMAVLRAIIGVNHPPTNLGERKDRFTQELSGENWANPGRNIGLGLRLSGVSRFQGRFRLG